MAENIRKKIQLYRTAQSGTTASDVVIGELAMNYNSNSPFVMFKDNIGNIQKLGALSEVTGSSVFHTMTQKAITDAISSSNSNSSNQFDKIEASIGLANDGTYVKTDGDYTSDATTIAGAIDALDSALKSEETDRIAADNALQDALNAEASARTAADNAEASARTAADEALQDAIDAEVSARTAAVNAEASARTAADETLQNALNAEASARTAADEALQAELDLTQTNIGLNANGTYTQRTDSNYINEATTVVGAINELDEALKQTTSDLQDYVQDSIDAMNVSEIGQSGSYISSVKQVNGKLAASTKVLVDANDDVLTFTENGITSTISIAKLTESEVTALGESNVKDAYKLIGKNNEQLGQTIKIYKDQSLKSVTFDGDTQELVYTYIVSDGSESEVRVDVSSFLTEAEYGNGLQVINHVISTKLGEDTATNKNFLDLEGDEEGKKSLVVRSVDTDRTYTTEDITVMGGPLASLLTNVGINKIDAGTDIQTLLMTLLCKEIYPYNSTSDSWYMADEATLGNQKKVSYSTPNFTSSIGAPTISGWTTETVLEPGSKFTFTVTVPAVTNKNTASTVSNLTWGYSAADDDSADSTATSITKNWTSGIGTDSYTLKTTVNNGFNSITKADVTGTNASRPTYSLEVQVADGTNKITWNVTGCTYTASVVENSSVYMVSNLGKTDSAIKTNVIAAKSLTTSASTNSTNKSVTGTRNSFGGAKQGTVGLSNVMQLSSANIRALGSMGTGNTFSISFGDNTSHVYIAVPPGKTLKSVADTGAFGTDIVASFKANTTTNVPVEGANGYTAKNYTVYVYAPDALLGANIYNVTIE